MAQRSAAWRYGWRLGLAAAGFAALQVLVMVSAGHAAAAQINTLQLAFLNTTDPESVLGALLIMVVLSYLAMVLTGVVMLYLAYQAGRLAASVSGRTGDGAMAGLWVAVVSGAVWLVLSLVVVAITHTDGTLSGAFTAHPAGALRTSEVVLLGAQEVLLALVGLGLGAALGARGGTVGVKLADPALRGPAFRPAAQAPWPPQSPWGPWGAYGNGYGGYPSWPQGQGAPASPPWMTPANPPAGQGGAEPTQPLQSAPQSSPTSSASSVPVTPSQAGSAEASGQSPENDQSAGMKSAT